MHIAIAFPADMDTGMESQTYLVPEPDALGWVDRRLGEVLDDLHHVLDGWLVGAAPSYPRGIR